MGGNAQTIQGMCVSYEYNKILPRVSFKTTPLTLNRLLIATHYFLFFRPKSDSTEMFVRRLTIRPDKYSLVFSFLYSRRFQGLFTYIH